MLSRHHRHGRLPKLRPFTTSTSATPPPAPASSNAASLDPVELAPDDAIAMLPSLADSAGSAAALALFRRLSARADMRRLMHLYATTATTFVARGNLPMAHEAMRTMVAAFADAGRLQEAADMVLEMRSHGLPLCVETANWVLRVGLGHPGCFPLARRVFDGMTARGGDGEVRPDARSFRALVLGCCRDGPLEDVDALLSAMWARGFCLDHATCTVVVRAFCLKGRFKDVAELFRRMSGMGTQPNVVNYTAWIDGLCKRGHVKQAFHVLEEMVRKGLKPNVYTHTSLIDGLCKIGWTEWAFRLFLKLIKSSSYKPNVHTYTVMIGGYCKEGKLARAEMLLGRMVEQGLAANTNTYTTLIDGHCKGGSFGLAFELLNKMKQEGFLPNIYSYNVIIGGFCKKGRIKEVYKITYALDLFNRMAENGCHPDINTYITIIAMYCQQRQMEESQKLFEKYLATGLVPTKQTYTSLIAGYCQIRKSTMALRVFETMAQNGCLPDSITYGVISGLCKESRLEEARALYEGMLDKQLVPCEVTRVTLAFEYCRRQKTDIAVSILERLDKKQQTHTADALVRKLSTLGNLDAACLFLQNILGKDYAVDHVCQMKNEKVRSSSTDQKFAHAHLSSMDGCELLDDKMEFAFAQTLREERRVTSLS
ncbi:hypothetical protein EJB05_26860, partial [Eragrostis curvula]